MTTATDQVTTAEELLPFWVNGTLAADERALVEQAMAAHPALARQGEVLMQVRISMQSDDQAVGPGELGLARLQRAIKPAQRAPTGAVLHVLTAAAAAVATLVLVALTGSGKNGDLYLPASAVNSGPTITVAFNDGVALEQISEILLQHDLTIADGPSAIGLYQLRLPAGRQMDEILASLAQKAEMLEILDHSE